MSNSIPNRFMEHISFVGSFPDVRTCPSSDLPEFAFAGRSNVGKSSLINYLCNRKNLAHISGTPGKTQMINLYNIQEQWILADLPGYGYARTSKKKRSQFSQMISQYLVQRANLFCVFQLIDVRHPPQEMDLSQINWMGEQGIPFVLVFTKADKLKEDEVAQNVSTYSSKLLESWNELPPYFITSASSKTGGEELLNFIAKTLKDKF